MFTRKMTPDSFPATEGLPAEQKVRAPAGNMSRLGRDYLTVGILMETFRKRNLRLISIADNIDTFRSDDDLTTFRNIFNEWYAQDISRKKKYAKNCPQKVVVVFR